MRSKLPFLGSSLSFTTAPAVPPEPNHPALCARNLAEEGAVLLAQRRVAGDRVAYLAIKARDTKVVGGRA